MNLGNSSYGFGNPITRRAALRIGGCGLLGLTLPKLLRATEGRDGSGPAWPPRAKQVIFLFQWGGPSHVDTFDMKPSAPSEYRGPVASIPSSVPGLPVCSHLPRMAQMMHKVTLVRTMTHTMNNHNSAGYYALTGSAPATDDQRLPDALSLYPAYGSVVDRLLPNQSEMPTFVAYPHRIRDGSVTPGQHASFLGKAHDPFLFFEDPSEPDFRLPELTLPSSISVERLMRRRGLQQLIDRQTALLEGSAEARGFDQYYDRAIRMITSPRVRKSFDLSGEPASLRERYGHTTYGQSCLLARRLVEAGVKFVTVYFSDTIGGQSTEKGGWDTHGFNDTRMFPIVKDYHFPVTDQTLPTLLADLDDRGLLDETLVLWVGEFGRTPKINGNASRDHWPHCYTALLAGGGVKQGFVYGRSDDRGEHPAEDPVTPDDLAATMYYLLGIDPQTEIYDLQDRPLPITLGSPVLGVVA